MTKLASQGASALAPYLSEPMSKSVVSVQEGCGLPRCRLTSAARKGPAPHRPQQQAGTVDERLSILEVITHLQSRNCPINSM